MQGFQVTQGGSPSHKQHDAVLFRSRTCLVSRNDFGRIQTRQLPCHNTNSTRIGETTDSISSRVGATPQAQAALLVPAAVRLRLACLQQKYISAIDQRPVCRNTLSSWLQRQGQKWRAQVGNRSPPAALHTCCGHQTGGTGTKKGCSYM